MPQLLIAPGVRLNTSTTAQKALLTRVPSTGDVILYPDGDTILWPDGDKIKWDES